MNNGLVVRMDHQSTSSSTVATMTASVTTLRKRVFILLAVHCDQLIMYNEDISADEAESRAQQSLTGLTIASLDFANPRHVRYNGLCLRSAWRPLSPSLFRRLKRALVYRDKCCNQRNFGALVPMVNTTQHTYKENERRMPDGAYTLQSFYRYDCGTPEHVDQPLVENPYLTGLNGTTRSEKRYAEHYKRIVEFIQQELVRWNEAGNSQPVIVYHKLPVAIANWLPDDLHRINPRLKFKFLGHTVSAKWARTSPHCRYRPNHNVCVCEICLIDEYAAQLVNALNNDTNA